MIAIYEVLPFTFNYSESIGELYQVFFNENEAYQYANQFKWVEITTNKI